MLCRDNLKYVFILRNAIDHLFSYNRYGVIRHFLTEVRRPLRIVKSACYGFYLSLKKCLPIKIVFSTSCTNFTHISFVWIVDIDTETVKKVLFM